jgi:membrane protein implicated in regulation of membrane protease activity
LSRGRTDIWIPVFKGRLTDSGGAVVLSGLLRPSWPAVFAFAYPFVLFAIGLLPRVEIRFQIIALAAPSALVLWGMGPWFDRKNNAARRQAIIGLMERALAGGA